MEILKTIFAALVIAALVYLGAFALGLVTVNDAQGANAPLGWLTGALLLLWVTRREIFSWWSRQRGSGVGPTAREVPATPPASPGLRRCLELLYAHRPAEEREHEVAAAVDRLGDQPAPAFRFLAALARPSALGERDPFPVSTPYADLAHSLPAWVKHLAAFAGIREDFDWSFPDHTRSADIAALRGLSDWFASHGRTLMHFDAGGPESWSTGLPALVVVPAALAPELKSAARDAGFFLANAEDYWASPQGLAKITRADAGPPLDAAALARDGRVVIVAANPDHDAPADVLTLWKLNLAAFWLAEAAALYNDHSANDFDLPDSLDNACMLRAVAAQLRERGVPKESIQEPQSFDGRFNTWDEALMDYLAVRCAALVEPSDPPASPLTAAECHMAGTLLELIANDEWGTFSTEDSEGVVDLEDTKEARALVAAAGASGRPDADLLAMSSALPSTEPRLSVVTRPLLGALARCFLAAAERGAVT